MLTQNINFSKFGVNKNYFKTKIFVKKTLKKYSKDKFFQSLSNRYIYSFKKKKFWGIRNLTVLILLQWVVLRWV